MSLISSQHNLQFSDGLNDMLFIKVQLASVHSAPSDYKMEIVAIFSQESPR